MKKNLSKLKLITDSVYDPKNDETIVSMELRLSGIEVIRSSVQHDIEKAKDLLRHQLTYALFNNSRFTMNLIHGELLRSSLSSEELERIKPLFDQLDRELSL